MTLPHHEHGPTTRKAEDVELLLRLLVKKHGGYPYIPWASFGFGEERPALSEKAREWIRKELERACCP